MRPNQQGWGVALALIASAFFDKRVISFSTLANAFLFAHDPTKLNRQGPDVGTDYRSIVFYRTQEEKNTLLNLIKRLTNQSIILKQ